MTLVLDNREKDLKEAFPNALYENLDIGDIKIIYNNQIFLLIERKTIKDVISSIKDGRYREQKKRLLSSPVPKNRIMYLIEGSLSSLSNLNNYNSNMLSIFGMIINTLFRDNLIVLRMENINETIYFIKRILEKLKEPDNIFILQNNIENTNNTLNNTNTNTNNTNTNNNTNNIDSSSNDNTDNTNNNLIEKDINLEYLGTLKLKKKENLTPYNCSILQLTQIPYMSVNSAKIVLDKYKSISNLINVYYQTEEKERPNMLSNLEINITNGKKRKLGNVLSEKIYRYLFNL